MAEEQINPQKEDSETPDKDKNSKEGVPLAAVDIGKVHTKDYASAPNANDKTRKRKPLSCFEIWTIILASAGIIVAAGTGAAIVWQDVIANCSLVEIKKQYPELKKSADAAKSAAVTANASLMSGNQSAAHTLAEMQKQSAAMRQNAVASDLQASAFISIQRPFISAQMAPVTRLKNLDWQFVTQWENEGTTPTKEAFTYSNFHWQPTPLPENYDFPDLGNRVVKRTIVGAKGAVFSQTMDVPSSIFRGVQDRTMHLYFWGWMTYHDIFPQTPLHLTEFCLELTTINGDINGNLPLQMIYSHCATRDCADQTCEIIKAMTALAES